MPGRNLNLVDVLTALGQGVIEDIPADPNEVVNNLLSDCEHVGMHGTWCCKGVRLIGGPFLWDSALWNFANWDGAFNQFVAVPQPGYVNAVLTDRPYAYYRLDETFACFGGKVIDSSGGVHDGVASGSITYNVPGALAGDPDTAMSFNTTGSVGIPNFVGWAFLPSSSGSTSYDSAVLYDSHLVYDGTGTANQTTVELWIKLASLPTANVTAFGVPSAYSLQVTPSGHISLGNESGGTITTAGALVVGTYSHIVGIINASSSTLYINGNPDVSGAVSIPTGTSAGTAHIAAGGAKYGVVVSADTPKAYWRMDDTGSTLVDASGNGNSGTITGGVTRSVTGLTADGDTAMSFNGSTGWVDVPYTSSLNFTTAVSVECLIKPNVLQTSLIAVQDFGNPDNTDYRWQLNIQPNGSQWIIQWQIDLNGTIGTVWSSSHWPQLIQQQNPIGWWRLDESSGTSAADSSGNGHTGTIGGAVTLGVSGGLGGDSDTCFSFAGSLGGGDIDIPDNSQLDPTGSISLVCLVYVTSLPGSSAYQIIGKGTTPSYLLRIDSSAEGNKVSFFVDIGGAPEPRCSSLAPPTLNTWHLVVGTFDGSNLRLYMDGILQNTVARSGSVAVDTGTLTLGSHPGSPIIDTRLDEMIIYNRALSSTDVAALTQAWQVNNAVFLTSGSTYHVVGTWDGTTMNLYMNGVSMGTTTLSGSLNLTNKHINIGQNSLFGDFYSGVLDEIAVYSTALSASRVASHYGAVSGTQVPGLNATVDEVAIYDKTLTTDRIQAHYNARAVQVGKAGENTKISTTYSAITLPALLWGGSASTSFWAGGGGSRNAWG